MRERGLFDTIVGSFRQRLSSLPDKRTGKNTRYGMEDAALSAFSVFFTQTPSFLAYQRMMEGSKGKSNAQSLFGVHRIPSDNQIRDLLDAVAPEQVFPVFEEILQVLAEQGQLEGFRSVAGTLLIAIDGTEYFSSSQIRCSACSKRTQKSGETRYLQHALLFRTIGTMVESRFRCEAEDEFSHRYYHWALEDAEREVTQEFPFISRIKDRTALEFLLVMRSLPLNEQLSYSRIHVKEVFQHIRKNNSETLTDAERTLWEGFYRKQVAVRKTLYRDGVLKDLDTKVKYKIVRTLIEAEVGKTIGTLFSSEGTREFGYRKTIEPWNVDTFFYCGGRAKLRYVHIIAPLEENNLRIKPLAVVDLLIWQGIGQMGWNLMTDEDAPLAANLLANVCTHFMNVVPSLLTGLSPNLIPPEQT